MQSWELPGEIVFYIIKYTELGRTHKDLSPAPDSIEGNLEVKPSIW